MGKGRYVSPPAKQLTPEDKEFAKRITDGEKKAPAFRASYPNHPWVVKWRNSEPGSPDRQMAMERVVAAAKTKLQSKYFVRALTTYQDKMDEFSELSLETATELVKNARSEKVRADLAMEGIRHKVGTPTQKIAVQEKKEVILTFSPPPKDERINVPNSQSSSASS